MNFNISLPSWPFSSHVGDLRQAVAEASGLSTPSIKHQKLTEKVFFLKILFWTKVEFHFPLACLSD